MSDITRQKTIDYLYYLKTHDPKNLIIPEYIDFAISSLETDESYQLEYESTTKNNLGVEKIVDVLGSYTDLDIPYKREIAENILTKLSSVTPQPRVDFKELKRKILMEVDGGTDDAWLAYGEVFDRISNSIDEFVADMREVKA